LSYRVSWSRTFKTADFYTKGHAGLRAPHPCPEHEPYCFKSDGYWGGSVNGTAYLIDLLDISSIMQGTRRKLLTISIDAMAQWGGTGGSSDAFITLVADGANIFERSLYHGVWEWKKNLFELNKDVEVVKKLDVQYGAVITNPIGGWVDLHGSNIILTGEYYVTIPPPTATIKVNIVNRDTMKPVNRAYVALISGAIVVADGFTDSSGDISFNNIDKGSYTLRVTAGGYRDFEQSIDVMPPTVSYRVKVVPIPVTPLPWWLVPVVIGTVVLGGGAVVYTISKKPAVPSPPVIVMR